MILKDDTRWGSTLKTLAALPLRSGHTVKADISDTQQFANQLRSMLSANKMTMLFKWSVKMGEGAAFVTKTGKWDHDELREDMEEAAITKTKPTAARKTMKVTHERQTTEKRSVELAEVVPVNGQQQEAMTTIFLKSHGAVRLIFAGDMFSVSKADREFLYSLVDRMHRYRDGDKLPKLAKHSQADGQKLYPVLMTLESLEDIYTNCMSEEEEKADRAAMLAAWFRGDPSVKPPKAE